MDSILTRLLELPLFHGVSNERISEIVGHIKLNFLKYPEGATIINAGTPCNHIQFILNGQVRSTIENSDGRFSVSQTLTGPDVVAPDCLFGLKTCYPCTVKAQTIVNILSISKADYLEILKRDSVFMINYLNLLSMNAQKAVHGILALTTGSIEERVALWLISLSQSRGRDITLTCRRRDMYAFFGLQRSAFFSSLDKMKETGLIDYTANEIKVINRRGLVALIAG